MLNLKEFQCWLWTLIMLDKLIKKDKDTLLQRTCIAFLLYILPQETSHLSETLQNTLEITTN